VIGSESSELYDRRKPLQAESNRSWMEFPKQNHAVKT